MLSETESAGQNMADRMKEIMDSVKERSDEDARQAVENQKAVSALEKNREKVSTRLQKNDSIVADQMKAWLAGDRPFAEIGRPGDQYDYGDFMFDQGMEGFDPRIRLATQLMNFSDGAFSFGQGAEVMIGEAVDTLKNMEKNIESIPDDEEREKAEKRQDARMLDTFGENSKLGQALSKLAGERNILYDNSLGLIPENINWDAVYADNGMMSSDEVAKMVSEVTGRIPGASRAASKYDLSGDLKNFGTGTPSGMIKASEFVQTVQDMQGFYISCIEEIAWRRGFIDDAQLKTLGEELKMTDYGKYLLSLLED